MVVSWISLLLLAGVLASVNGECPPAHIADYTAYPMQFNISNNIVYDIFKGKNEYKEEFRRYFNLNHSLVSSEERVRITHCRSHNRLTLLNMNGSLIIDDKSKRSMDPTVDGNHLFTNGTFQVHRSLPLHFKYAGDDSKWHTSKEAAIEMIVCGNGSQVNSSVVAYTKVTIPKVVGDGKYCTVDGDHNYDLFDPNSVHHGFTCDLECCRLEVKIAFAQLQSFIDEKSAGSHLGFWLFVLLIIGVPLAFLFVAGTALCVLSYYLKERARVPAPENGNAAELHEINPVPAARDAWGPPNGGNNG